MLETAPFVLPSKLYKYRSMKTWRDRRKVKDILLRNRLYFATRLGFNDPFDCRISPSWDDSTTEEWRQTLLETHKIMPVPEEWKENVEGYVEESLKGGVNVEECKAAYERCLDNFRVLCLCQQPDGILMWSHYANNHEGVCLEFEVRKGSFFMDAKPVQYPKDYPQFKATIGIEKLANGIVGTKAKLWEYEAEWRVGKLDQNALSNFPTECLSGVILGCQVSDKNEALICKWLTKRISPATLYRAVKEEHKFAVRIDKVKEICPPPM